MSVRATAAVAASAGLAAFALGFLPAPESRIALFVGLALPMLLANIVLVLVAAYLVARRGLRVARDDLIAAAVLALVLVGIALLVPGRMRIHADEYLVAATAFGIWLEGTPQAVAGALFDAHGAAAALGAFPDKRGVLLPLLLAFGGADWRTGMAINLGVGWTALLGLYALARQFARPSAALAGALLLAASPVFAWACRSILLEPLNLALLAWTALAALAAARSRRVEPALLLALLAPLLAQARYESVLGAALAVAGALWLLARHAPRGVALGAAALVPFLFLPFAWQRAVDFAWGLENIGASRAFAVEYASANSREAAQFFVRPSTLNPLAPALIALAAVGAYAAIRTPARIDAAARMVLVGGLATVLAGLVVVLAFAWGDLNAAVTARLGLPAIALVCLGAARGLEALRVRLAPGGAIALALAGAVLAFALPSMRAEYLFDGRQIGRPLDRVVEWLHAGYPACRPLVVSAYGPFFVANRVSATDLAHLGPLLGRVDSVLLLRLDDEHGAPQPGNALPDALLGRTVLDEQVTDQTAVRVFELRRDPGSVHAPKCP